MENYPELPEDKLYEKMHELNAEYLDDERRNLDIQFSQPILVIGDLGFWNGRAQGYKMVNSGNIRDCLYSDTDMTEWYVDKNGDLRADAIHHDGTNHYLYRVFKRGVTDAQIENLQDKIYAGEQRADITKGHTAAWRQHCSRLWISDSKAADTAARRKVKQDTQKCVSP